MSRPLRAVLAALACVVAVLGMGGVPTVLVALLIGGTWLLLRDDGERVDCAVGSVAFAEGMLLVFALGVYYLV